VLSLCVGWSRFAPEKGDAERWMVNAGWSTLDGQRLTVNLKTAGILVFNPTFQVDGQALTVKR
jgi:hypothetical protein